MLKTTLRTMLKLLACHLQDFFANFQDRVSVKQFQYDKEIKGTVLEGDTYFGSEKAVRAAIPPGKTASYSDLVRYVLLHNYGGLWWAHSSRFPLTGQLLLRCGACASSFTELCCLLTARLFSSDKVQGWALGVLTEACEKCTEQTASRREPLGAG